MRMSVTPTARAMPSSVHSEVRRCRAGSGRLSAGDRESFDCILLELVARDATLGYARQRPAVALDAAARNIRERKTQRHVRAHRELRRPATAFETVDAAVGIDHVGLCRRL